MDSITVQHGLTAEEAQKRLEEDGANALSQPKRSIPVLMFFAQFKDFLTVILLAATAVSFFLGEYYDALSIILIVLLNAVLGFIQEYRTEKTLNALKEMTAPTARVYRGGVLSVIAAAELVRGDIIALEAGDKVPADCVITYAKGVLCDESILTGEAVPVEKGTDRGRNEYSAYNELFSGTILTKGHAEAEVTATGAKTRIGGLSDMIAQSGDKRTPLQIRLAELGRRIAVICLIVCAVVAGAGILHGEPVMEMLLTGISIAIAAIPEGLPAAVTIALAIAVRRMLKLNALVHKLHSVETLGCTSVICTDKTGTVTENKMTVTEIFTLDGCYEVLGSGLRVSGEIRNSGKALPHPTKVLRELFLCSVICTGAVITDNGDGFYSSSGDPTEAALLVAAAKGGVTAESIKSRVRLIDEIPFDSETRRMTVKAMLDGSMISYTKGAADAVIAECAYCMTESGLRPMTRQIVRRINEACGEMYGRALRVLALCADYGDGAMVFLGCAGMLDKPREEAKKAIRQCASAGIKTVMITGDHANTAVAVARQAGILSASEKDTSDNVMTGEELDRTDDDTLKSIAERIRVYARVSPAHKLRIVKALKANGHVVTMTGDGVNDAPAIKEAHIGVAMGLTGTDVTRQAADLILLDDNFATLVNAVREGRGIYANIRKFVRYLLSCNIGEVVTMFVGILIGLPVVLIPAQILLVNLITDGLPAVALGVEPCEESQMRQKPRKAGESFFSGGLTSKIVIRGLLIGVFTLASFAYMLLSGTTVETARTSALFTLVASQLLHVFECKSESRSIFTVDYANNPKLLLAVACSLIVVLAAIYFPPLQLVFRTVPLAPEQLLTAFLLSLAAPVLRAVVCGVSSRMGN